MKDATRDAVPVVIAVIVLLFVVALLAWGQGEVERANQALRWTEARLDQCELEKEPLEKQVAAFQRRRGAMIARAEDAEQRVRTLAFERVKQTMQVVRAEQRIPALEAEVAKLRSDLARRKEAEAKTVASRPAGKPKAARKASAQSSPRKRVVQRAAVPPAWWWPFF